MLFRDEVLVVCEQGRANDENSDEEEDEAFCFEGYGRGGLFEFVLHRWSAGGEGCDREV